jgi:hypothetical protein
MGIALGLLQFFLSPIGRWISVGLLIALAYGAGYFRGERIEYAQCEAKAKAAQQAADAQDLQAAKDVSSDAAQTMAELKKQKDASDAKIVELQNRLTTVSVPVGAPCLYGDNDLPDSRPVPPAGGVQHDDGKGTRNPHYPRPARVPAANPKAAIPQRQ